MAYSVVFYVVFSIHLQKHLYPVNGKILVAVSIQYVAQVDRGGNPRKYQNIDVCSLEKSTKLVYASRADKPFIIISINLALKTDFQSAITTNLDLITGSCGFQSYVTCIVCVLLILSVCCFLQLAT